jgi:PAS domain-containing protein
VRQDELLKWRPHPLSVESLNAFILDIDTAGIVKYANDACHLGFGIIEGELFFQRVVQSLDQFVARTQSLATKNLSIENLFSSSIELAVTDREMMARVVIATVDGIYSEEGVVGYSLVMVPKPLSSTALESVLIQSLPAGIVATDLDGTIRCWNRGSNSLLGYTETEAIGKNIRELTKRSFSRDGEGTIARDLIFRSFFVI